jgi:hypothetical protein
LTSDPVEPVLPSRNSAVAPVCSASAELNKPAVMGFEVLAVDELPGPLVEEPADADVELVEVPDVPELLDVLELLDAGGVGGVGRKVWWPVPKPISDANSPPTVTESLLFLPVMTRLPLLLR